MACVQNVESHDHNDMVEANKLNVCFATEMTTAREIDSRPLACTQRKNLSHRNAGKPKDVYSIMWCIHSLAMAALPPRPSPGLTPNLIWK